MQTGTIRALEFDRVRGLLAREALTPMGRARALALEPSADREIVRDRLEMTAEAVAFVTAGGSLAVRASEDLPGTLAVLDIDEQPLDPLALLAVATFFESVAAVVDGLRHASEVLRGVAEGAASFEHETAAVRRAIDPAGEVSDRASSALREIRDALRRQRAKLRSSLESLARGRDTAKYLQDQIVTDRNGRYVLVVRSEHRDAIAGIVHGSSTSGASLYLEPLATVQLNNDVVGLAERERAEVRRILGALTDGFRQRREDLEATIGVAVDLDELHAKAALARRMGAVRPSLSDDTRIEFLGARHPLLGTEVFSTETAPRGTEVARSETGVRENPGFDRSATSVPFGAVSVENTSVPVPSDLIVGAPAPVLIISGPNTGGKTVALKAFGLLALMAQAGLMIPVEPGSRFSPFQTIFADIGDEQSIAASLSTFSAHIANLVSMDRALALPTLILLDEVGGGTDPVEGGSLGAAVIDHFRRRGALVVATTHDDVLKSYGATTEGAVAASFGFNPETYAPTYRLVYGAPGRSLALEIAERLGLPADVIEDARARRSARDSQLAAHLAKLDEQLNSADAERQRAAADRRAVADERQQLLTREARLAEREAVLKRRLDDRLNEKLREARVEIDGIVGTLKKRAETLAEQAERRMREKGAGLTTGELGNLRSDAQQALGAVRDAVEPSSLPAPAAAVLDDPPEIGQSVFVATFNTDGIVGGLSGKYAYVDIRGKRMRVSLSDLRRPVADAPRVAVADGGRVSAGGVRVQTAARADFGVTPSLVLVGSTIDQAIDRAEKFLDDALLADERRVRFVHGHGTGRLREALTKFLREHPLVSSVTQAPDSEGGAGATIAELKD